MEHGIIDVHTHILPGVDDGSPNMEESVRMLQLAAEQGITAVIATPHASRRSGAEKLKPLAAELRERIREVIPGFELYLGQETFYREDLPERLKSGNAISIEESRYVLVEFEPSVPYSRLYQGLRKLTESGYKPVLAHMERYRCLRDAGCGELLSLGCKLQMNYESLQGHWFQKEVRWCRKQVQDGTIHLLGSDMHRMDFRPPNILPARTWLESHIDEAHLRRMQYENPLHLIQNEKF